MKEFFKRTLEIVKLLMPIIVMIGGIVLVVYYKITGGD
jgi:hypothetical protein